MKIRAVFITLLLIVSSLYSADSIGKVIAVEGQAQANERSLTRGAAVFVSDVIKVAGSSKLQIRFTDGGVINLIELSEYRIDSYQFNKTGSDGYSAELVKGGFRSLTGSIAKSNQDGYSVKTPVSTIGIRGTLFEVNIVDGVTYHGVEKGAIVLKNSGGEETLHAGQYLATDSPNVMGTPTTALPDALNPQLFTSPPGGITLETAREPTGLGGGLQLEISEFEGNPPCS